MKTHGITQIVSDVERRELLAAHWGPGAVTSKNRVQLPPEALRVAPIRIACRSLVVEADCDSQNDYLRILGVAANCEATAELKWLSTTPIPNKQHLAADVVIEKTWNKFAKDVEPLARAFADRWLSGNEDGALFITFMAASDALNVDISRIESERGLGDVWKTHYGKSSNNKERQESRQQTGDWKNFDDVAQMHAGWGWVRRYHFHYGSLRKFIEEDIDDQNSSDESAWRRRMKPINEVLGFTAKPGRPSQRAKSA